MRQKINNSFVNIGAPMSEAVTNKITFVDLFCGCGGMSKGYVDCGFEPIAAVDFNHAACETHRRNIDCGVIEGDITSDEVKGQLYEIVTQRLNGRTLDLLHASTPCQGLSLSGKRMIDDPRNRLYKEAVEIIGRLQPRYITMENVQGITSMQGGAVEKQIIEDLEGLGYKVDTAILNAADYGVPQQRKRWILIGNRVGKPILFPEPLLDKAHYVTVGEAIGDLVDREEDKDFSHVFAKHTDEMKARLMAVEEGKSLHKTFSETYRKCFWNEPSHTVKANNGGCNIHPKLARVLTPREQARLQSFDDAFLFCGCKTEQQKQIGNAVPPKLAKAIGHSIALTDSMPDVQPSVAAINTWREAA